MSNAKILSDFIKDLDSAAVGSFTVNSGSTTVVGNLDRTNAGVSVPLDSATTLSFIDSDYVNSKIGTEEAITDSGANNTLGAMNTNIIPKTKNATALGSASKKWKNIYVNKLSLGPSYIDTNGIDGGNATLSSFILPSDYTTTEINVPAYIASSGLQNVTGYEITQTAYNYGHTVHQSLLLNDDGNVFDDAALRSASTATSASWSSAYVANPATYFGADFDNYAQDLGYASISGTYHYLWSHSAANSTMSLTWTSGAVTVKHMFISGNNTNGYNYFAGGTVKFYINGVKESTARTITAFPSPYDTTNTFYIDLT